MGVLLFSQYRNYKHNAFSLDSRKGIQVFILDLQATFHLFSAGLKMGDILASTVSKAVEINFAWHIFRKNSK